jgi:hypothetical protein
MECYSYPVDLRGQNGEVETVSRLMGDVSGGFFIEAGAYDGEEMSNTLFFEAFKVTTNLF